MRRRQRFWPIWAGCARGRPKQAVLAYLDRVRKEAADQAPRASNRPQGGVAGQLPLPRSLFASRRACGVAGGGLPRASSSEGVSLRPVMRSVCTRVPMSTSATWLSRLSLATRTRAGPRPACSPSSSIRARAVEQAYDRVRIYLLGLT